MSPDENPVVDASVIPEAKLVTFYTINGLLFRKATLREGAENPAAVRAVSPGKAKNIGFFLPAYVGPSNDALAI